MSLPLKEPCQAASVDHVFDKIVGQEQQIEQNSGGLSAGMFIGNPFTDVPDLCRNSVVVTDGDLERAKA